MLQNVKSDHTVTFTCNYNMTKHYGTTSSKRYLNVYNPSFFYPLHKFLYNIRTQM